MAEAGGYYFESDNFQRGVKRAKTTPSTHWKADVSWDTGEEVYGTQSSQRSCIEQSQIVVHLGKQKQVPLLEQYRSVLSDLNGRQTQQIERTQGIFQRDKENEDPVSCSQEDRKSKLLLAPLTKQSGADIDKECQKDSLLLSNTGYAAELDARNSGRGSVDIDEEDDDAYLLFDWRRSAGAPAKQAKALRTDGDLMAGCEGTVPGSQCIGVSLQSTEDPKEKRDVGSSLGGHFSDWDEPSPSAELCVQQDCARNSLGTGSQDGALSELLDIVDREADSDADRGESASPGRKTRPLSEQERSQFILQASQAVLEDQSGGEESEGEDEDSLECPVCGVSLQQMSASERDAHTNQCLDSAGEQDDRNAEATKDSTVMGPTTEDVNRFGLDYAPLVAWLDRLQLGRYAAAMVKEEVDFDTLHCLKEEDLESMGVVALGPKRKLLAAIETLKQRSEGEMVSPPEIPPQEEPPDELPVRKPSANRRITDFFPAPTPTPAAPPKGLITSFFTTPEGKTLPPPSPKVTPTAGRGRGAFVPKKGNPPGRRGSAWKQVSPDPPEWHLVPGTDFRVDAFRFQTPHCRHWFLSHFHADHYQGLTRNFRHGTIFCTPITARLVQMKLGVPLEKLHPIPLNQRTRIDNCHVTLLEANHCPGAAMMLFEPDGAKPTLHTGDFRYCPAMAEYSALQKVKIGTLILDTTYCDPQYDFPGQDAVIQFVIDAIQAETFNPKTLFLIGAYTIGKERVFLEVARELNTKVYVGAARRKVLACLDLPPQDMARLTTNENESNVHVVPLWSLANFKRMASIAKHYQGRYNTFVSFSPTGWSFGRGKRRTTGTRKQQGTIVRYEVPYSEHSSFSELRTFVRLIKPAYILPHVNNDGGQKADTMIAELLKAHKPDAQK